MNNHLSILDNRTGSVNNCIIYHSAYIIHAETCATFGISVVDIVLEIVIVVFFSETSTCICDTPNFKLVIDQIGLYTNCSVRV